MKDTIGELHWKRINDVVIGQVINIHYLQNEDLIVINEERNGGEIKHTFGSQAPDLPELIDTLEQYVIAKHQERLELFKTIRSKFK